jgi:ABC-type Fe3+-siderophore transport system permease subunit
MFAPLLGKFADKFGVGAGQAIATILSASSLLFLSMTSVSLRAHVVGMSFYGVGRMFFFGLFFTNVGKRFGFDHYGTLAGLGSLISSLFGNIQYDLIALAADGHEREVNIACGSVMLILGLPYCLWLSRRERRHAFVK